LRVAYRSIVTIPSINFYAYNKFPFLWINELTLTMPYNIHLIMVMG